MLYTKLKENGIIVKLNYNHFLRKKIIRTDSIQVQSGKHLQALLKNQAAAL